MDDAPRLWDQVLDSKNNGVPKHLGQIAGFMYEWEGSIAEELELTPTDIAAIKCKYPGDLKLQTREALKRWKQTHGPTATYNNLIGAFERAGYRGYAEIVKKVSQDLSTTDSIRHYAEKLKDVYKVQNSPESKWPCIHTCTRTLDLSTKLVIIKRKDDDSVGSSEFKFECDHLHGEVESIVGYKKEIELPNVLDPVPSHDKQQPPEVPKVLMDGAPGVGKTTLTLIACRDWAAGTLFRQYHLVILIPLRQARYRRAKKIEDLFPGDNTKAKQEAISYVIENGGKKTLLIFDGYDELNSEQRKEDSLFMEIICGIQLRHCAVLVTSRPYASGALQELPSINRHVEVVGFKKEQINACIRKIIHDKVSSDKLIAQLKEREDIASLCYIPLNCIIMIHVYEQNKTLPTTMTELLHQFILDSVIRDVKFVERNSTLKMATINKLNCLPEPLAERLMSLEKLAYQSLVKDQFVFSQVELNLAFTNPNSLPESDVTSFCLGLVTSITSVSDSAEHHFQFLHLSIQEFLAARYASKSTTEEEQIDLLRKYISDPRFRLFLLFYVGMMPLKKDAARIAFCLRLKSRSQLEPRYHQSDPNVSKFLYFAHMIFESQQFETFIDLFDSLSNNKVLSLKHHKLTLFDCMVLAHFLCSIDHSWRELDLQDCSLSVQSLQVFDQVYKQRKPGMKTTFEHINFSENDPEMISSLNLFPWLSGTKTFTFHCDNFKVNESLDLHFLAPIPQLEVGHSYPDDTYLDTDCKLCVCTSATEVILSQAVLGEATVKYLDGIKVLKLTKVNCEVLQTANPYLQTLEVLVLREIDDIDMWISRSASYFAQSNTLQTLKLLKTGLTVSSTTTLFQSLKKNTSITELNISGNTNLVYSLDQCEELGQALEALLRVNETIESLQMCKSINDQLAQFLITGLAENSTLDNLNVCDNSLSTNTIQDLINVTMNHSRLSQLSVENNSFQKCDTVWTLQYPHMVTERLFCAFIHLRHLHHSYSAVVSLTLSSRTLDSLTCIRLFQNLQQNKYVKHLSLSDGFHLIASDRSVGCALERTLSVNSTLDTLHYSSSSTTIQAGSDSVCEYLAAGLSKCTSLRSLSLRMHSFSDTICIMDAFKYSRLKVLELTSMSSSFFSQDDYGPVLEQLLITNSTLVDLYLGANTPINDIAAAGIAKGLHKNRSLRKIQLTFDPLISYGAAKLFLSVSNSGLLDINVGYVCSLSREDGLDWNLQIQKEGFTKWSQLQHVFIKSEEGCINVKTITISKHSTVVYACNYQMSNFFSVLTLHENLIILDFSKLRSSDREFGDDRLMGRMIGVAIKELLKKVFFNQGFNIQRL